MARSLITTPNGLLWMVTEKGITNFNGHTAKHYQATKDSSGLLPVPVFQLFSDKKGIIWISYMDACISKFNPETEKFTHYYHDSTNKNSFPYGAASQFIQDKKGTIWMAVWGAGLSKYNEANNDFTTYRPVKGDTTLINTTEITSLAEMDNGNLLVGTWESGGYGKYAFLQIFNPLTGKSKRFPFEDYRLPATEQISHIRAALKIVHFVHIDENKDYWIGTYLGLYHFNNRTKVMRRYSDIYKGEKYLTGGGIENCANVVQLGRKLWVGTEVTGIMVVDMDNGKTQTLNHYYENNTTLSGDNILGLFKDSDNNIWVSTRAGIDVYSSIMQQFKFLANVKTGAEKSNKSQGSNSVVDVLSYKDSLVYMSHGNGISIYDRANDTVQRIFTKVLYRELKNKFNLHEHVNPGPAGDIEETENEFLVNNNGILLALNKKTLNPTYLYPYNMLIGFAINKEKTKILTHSFPIRHGKGKSAQSKGGYHLTTLNAFNYEVVDTFRFEDLKFQDHKWHENGSICYLQDNNWIVHGNRICFFVFDANSKTVKTYSSRNEYLYFPDSMLTILAVDKSGYAWIRGTAGIYKFDYRTGKSKLFNDSLKINQEVVQSIMQDHKNRLWFACGADIIRYNLNTKETYRYTSELGLHSGGFTTTKNIPNSSKYLYFAGPYGVTYFDPDKMEISKRKPNLFLVNMVLNKDTLNEATKVDYLIHDKKIPWDKNFVTFEFATYQYYSPGKKIYAYRLLGLDTTWVQNDSRNYVSYTNLSDGFYQFEVKCKNVFNVESDVYNISFTIDKPFWKKWWFILIEILLAGGLIYLYIRNREKNLNKQKDKLERKVEERTKELVEKAEQIEHQSVIINEKNKELTDSIKYARRIQGTLLAKLEFMKENLPEHFVLFKPKDIVSGDFYWATKIEAEMSEFIPGKSLPSNQNDELFYLAVCDSTGHGVPGAFMSLLNISYLNEAIGEMKMRTPNTILNYVRNKLIANLSVDGAQDGMDGTLVCFDKVNAKLTYASAHNKPILIRNGEMMELPADKMPIGKGERTHSFHLEEINYQKNDIVYFYTDGFADQFGGPKGKKFKYRKLNETLLNISKLSMAEQHDILSQEFDTWKGKLEQVDDVLLIGIRF
ncbi:MAG: SpoIIE family protein phosphatase [Sphingobacteriaceae bacterium]|nr:SpoIIE family protein phosphatase [Sphingobacteriaceae bacterium]